MDEFRLRTSDFFFSIIRSGHVQLYIRITLFFNLIVLFIYKKYDIKFQPVPQSVS